MKPETALTKDEIDTFADEAALTFIQREDVRGIETDGPKYRALVQAFVDAFNAGQRNAQLTILSQLERR